MSRGHCSPEQRAACPLQQKRCFSDTHHLAYPAKDYKDKVGEAWRERDFNKAQVCRAIHDAIHASGYIPERPERDQMLHEVVAKDIPRRALEERSHQLALGQAVMQSDPDYYKDKGNGAA